MVVYNKYKYKSTRPLHRPSRGYVLSIINYQGAAGSSSLIVMIMIGVVRASCSSPIYFNHSYIKY
jgi:hypothetical protein